MAAGGHFETKFPKKKLRIDLKWREMRSKVIFGHPKWPPAAILQTKFQLFVTFPLFSPLFPTYSNFSPLFPTFPYFSLLFVTFRHFSPLFANFRHFSPLFPSFLHLFQLFATFSNFCLQYSKRLQFYFWLFVCGQKVNFKWRRYQANRPFVTTNNNLASDNYKAAYINVSVILMPWLIDGF